MKTAAINPKATGRNGQDDVWETAHQAMLNQRWGVALEAMMTLNAFFSANAVDSITTIGDLKAAKMALPSEAIAKRIDAEAKRWNETIERRMGLRS